MVVSDTLDRRLRALSDPTRRDIVARTLHRDHAVSDLAAAYPMSFAAVQRHVAVLEDAGLVTKRAVHRHRYVRARAEALDEVEADLLALRDVWRGRVERMHDVLSDASAPEDDRAHEDEEDAR
ncbi:ArsR/SmtB family transcription factor [Actinomarinicola tropica]|uniref:Helix-turn-helix domain-containing protein n=1 Tax=Actinomarinicola tropica TaxID=2789776 RepID=A0A5Q2RH89_9ACTN|nr:metalloregulator ArsR/SmtB family transcription factor [Actinomarinicola tropica]QGG94222.1 helix-turn-helix domain-containing protein [Actinomarinicola tropica]